MTRDGAASAIEATTVTMPETRKQIKLTATPSRRAVPAVIASATDDGAEPFSPVADNEPVAASPVGSLADITLLAEAIGGDAIFILDRALRFSFVNRAAEALVGRSFDSIRGRPFATLAPDVPDHGDSQLLAHVRVALRSGKSEDFETVLPRQPDRKFRVFVTPHTEGVFVCMRDTTGVAAASVAAPTESKEDLELQASHDLLEQMIDLSPDVVYLYDTSVGANVYSNRAAAVAVGYSESEMEAMTPEKIRSLTVAEDWKIRERYRKELASGKNIVEYEYRLTHKNGSIRWMITRERVFGRDPDGSVRLILGYARDDTDRRAAVAAAAAAAVPAAPVASASRFEDNLPDCVITLDLNGGLAHINERGKALMEIRDFAPLIGAEWALLFLESYRSAARNAVHRALEGGSERFQGVAKTAIGTPLWWDVVVAPVSGSDGRPAQILTIARDITSFKSLESEREKLLLETITRADYDALTGLLNYQAFHRRLQEIVLERTPVAILLLELDNFKYVNDAYGRPAGDDLLKRMARELATCCRNSDTLARIGPNKFGIVAPDMRNNEVGPYVLRLRAAIDGIGIRSPDGADTIPLHIAVGYSLFPEGNITIEAAYELAAERRRGDHTGGSSREAERVRESLRAEVDSFGMLDTLIATIDGKDRMTRRQSEDTLIYSRRIAERFGLTDEQKRSLDLAALLHDVGKVGIDERILRQPGKLRDADFSIVQQHPKIGAMLVGSTVDDVDTVEAILYHHENWDGTGYPAGLSGEEIPLLARILNVASSYAAMTNNRPYRKGMTPNAAKKVIQGGAGTQWDPDCVSALISVAGS